MRFDGWGDEDATESLGPEEAIELIRMQLAILIAAVTGDMNYKGEGAEYRKNRRQLAPFFKRMRVKDPFPWKTLELAEAAAKAEATGTGSYETRRQFFRKPAAASIESLRKRMEEADSGDIYSAIEALQSDAEELLKDPSAIRAELKRIEASLPSDPGSAIGKAKNLVEATAKVVMRQKEYLYGDNDNLNKLASGAMTALGVDRKSVLPHDEVLANIMGRLLGLVHELSYLRNKAGDGHGSASAPTGLDLRHGRLAVRAALAWSSFMLDTLHDEIG